MDGREADDVVGSGGDADAVFFERVEDVAAHGVFEGADIVLATEKADGELDPVVGEAIVDAGLDAGGLDEEALPEDGEGGLGHFGDADGVFGGGIEENLFGGVAVILIGDGQMHLLPDVGEISGVVIDGLFEDPGVGDGDDAAGVLAAFDPHAGVVGLNAGRLAHLHDDGLDEVEGDDVTANAAHGDAVADVEGLSTQDNKVSGKAGDDLLQGKGEAGADEAHAGGEAGGVIEPDGDEAEDRNDKCDEADALTGPEDGFLLAAAEEMSEGPQELAYQEDDDQETDGEEELAAILGVEAEQLDAEDLQVAGWADELDKRRMHGGVMRIGRGEDGG